MSIHSRYCAVMLSLPLVFAVNACSSSDPAPAPATDDVGVDTSAVDAFNPVDTGSSTDSAADSGTDTGSADSGVADTKIIDADAGDVPADTASADTGTPDTGVLDTGIACGFADSGPTGDATDDADASDGGEVGAPVRLIDCGGACVDTTTDRLNCGGCGVACPVLDTCVAGACKKCSFGVGCGTECVDVGSDSKNCGGCGITCSASESCSSGTCVCSTGSRCFGTCVDTYGDAKNCGGCGVACGADQVCKFGSCTCASGLTDCTGSCKDTTVDNDNCGACGTKCATGTYCSVSACAATCGGGLTLCGGKCVDTTSDTANCGACATACTGTSSACLSGVCGAPPRVLFYAPATFGDSTQEKPYLPPGSVVTIGDDATWKAMTTADFAKYNLVVLGDAGFGTTKDSLKIAFDTRVTWNAAISGRIVVTGVDAGYHAGSTPGAVTYLRASFRWLTSGKGTALYVGSDWGTRSLDFLSGIGAFASVSESGDSVKITDATSPTMIGSTDSSMSSWFSAYHSYVSAFPASFKVVAAESPDTTKAIVITREAKP